MHRVAEPQLVEELPRARLELLARQPADVRVQKHIGERGPEVEQQVVLERDAHIGDRPGHRRAPDRDVAAAALEQARHHQQQRALAAAGGPDHRHELAGRDVDAHFLQRAERTRRVLAERLGDAVDTDRYAALLRNWQVLGHRTTLRRQAAGAADAAIAVSGTFETSSALRPFCRSRLSWSTTSTSNVAIACVGFDRLSRNSAMR